MKSDLHSRLTRLSPDDVLTNTALRGAIILCHEAASRIKELEAAIADANRRLSEVEIWGQLNAGQMQCNRCESAYGPLEEVIADLRDALK